MGASPHDEPTKDLSRRSAAGDRDAFAALYERIAPALYAWAALKVDRNPILRLEPEDVVQEVWCRALAALPRLDAEGVPFRAWVFRVAKNVLHEAVRRSLPGRGIQTCEGQTSRLQRLAAYPEEITTLTRRVARDESVERFLARLRALGEEECRLVIHRGLEGLSTAKTAARMGLSPEAVAKRWQRLRERLVRDGFARYLEPPS